MIRHLPLPTRVVRVWAWRKDKRLAEARLAAEQIHRSICPDSPDDIEQDSHATVQFQDDGI
jgi:hypothetical protein